MIPFKRVLLFLFGILLILVGVIGWVVPLLPGWVLIFTGFSFLAPAQSRRIAGLIRRRLAKPRAVFLYSLRSLGVSAGFTTRLLALRLSGASDFRHAEVQQRFLQNFQEAVGSAAGPSAPALSFSHFAVLGQVHGGHVAVLEDKTALERPGFLYLEGFDAAVTCVRGLTILVLSADCLSVFLAGGGWVGLVHAGWRGTKERIVQKAFRTLCEKSGCRPEAVRIAFGPCIGPAHYEVGPEFETYFAKAGSAGSPLRRRRGKLTMDLAAENRRQLLETGAFAGRIRDLGICTVAENRLFYSFRKEGENAGRMVSFIRLD